MTRIMRIRNCGGAIKMKVLVDTSVWSLALRRKELLSGISDEHTFSRLREKLGALDDMEITARDYETAAEYLPIRLYAGVK